MISRSDGISFDLLLADRPLPYPNERSVPTHKISACFWYSHVSEPKLTNATTQQAVFRVIETVAELLAQNLAQRGKLGQFYDFRGHSLFELAS